MRHLLLTAMILCASCIMLASCGDNGPPILEDGTDDTGSDADGDTDGDADGDSDGDTDTDGDSDGDGDVDSDSDTDADSDADADSDSDSDTSGECPFECVQAWACGGTVWNEYSCGGGMNVCCEQSTDTTPAGDCEGSGGTCANLWDSCADGSHANGAYTGCQMWEQCCMPDGTGTDPATDTGAAGGCIPTTQDPNQACRPAQSCCGFPTPSNPAQYDANQNSCDATWTSGGASYEVSCTSLGSTGSSCTCSGAI
jgi:hypothetical protein